MAIKLSQDESKSITLLKGLSILLVIFIHADFRKYLPSSINTESFDLWMQITTRILVQNAVPIFFFLSGFLFFLKKDTFKNKLKSRFRTLFIPYIFWTLWGFCRKRSIPTHSERLNPSSFTAKLALKSA
ncbi:acyltransferase family protein [Bacteroides mediterraneensis]|uniref:acyltransferase family protein n=1 Tax=Bacteroides mediterraneensis TaxID=1841856 RepID=UPI0009341892|nr:acyltransferase family protein [Bacteroides mediterraneensis]